MTQADPIFSSLSAASSGMKTQSFRMRLSAENLSNVDTPGYQRKLLFLKEMERGVALDRVSLSRQAGREVYEPEHPLADDQGMVEFSNVDLMVELADAREARRSVDANLQVFQQAQGFYRNLLNLLQR